MVDATRIQPLAHCTHAVGLGLELNPTHAKGYNAMTIVTTDMNLLEVSKLDGVCDLNIKIRGLFAKALIHEAKGDDAAAATALDKAIFFPTRRLQVPGYPQP